MSLLHSFSTHRSILDGNTVMLANCNIDSHIARQLSTYIKQDQSLCGYLHVFHRKLTPYISSHRVRTWFVDGQLVEIKDWLIDDCEGLVHYPIAPLDTQLEDIADRESPAQDPTLLSLDDNKLSWRRHQNTTPSPPLNLWLDDNDNTNKESPAQGPTLLSFDDNKLSWRHHHDTSPVIDTSAEASKANPEDLSSSFNSLELTNNLSTSKPSVFLLSSVSSNGLSIMDSPDPQTRSSDTQVVVDHPPQDEDQSDHLDATADGTVDRFIKKRAASPDKRDTMAVFVHAGAGYHSYQNEHVHLAMCSKAASQAMRSLKVGCLATEGVAIALKLLEDHDITNAGVGSNLTVEGQVECDATIVDHFGRSGACGAVPNIKNPIMLAKLILDTSLISLSLRRVPPNMLIGEGAKKFAVEHGMATVSNKELVSKNAEDRYKKWREDLQRAEARAKVIKLQWSSGQITPPNEASQAGASAPTVVASKARSVAHVKASQGLLRDHSSAVLTGMWNEGQPDSPSADPASPGGPGSDPAIHAKRSPLSASQNGLVRALDSKDESAEESSAKRRKTSDDKPAGSMDGVKDNMEPNWSWCGKRKAGKWLAGLKYPENDDDKKKIDATELTAEPSGVDPDLITDTIGVIVIDGHGNIAAGSSSGGIGMKHCGRVGPAALVGIGTAVIPRDTEDEDERVVATVTSGTGEHMATTMAAHKCAERLYHMTSRGIGGDDVAEVCSEAEVMEDFIMEDFMSHPGVKNQTSARAIGVLAAKMTSGGIYMHWAHNTDSFAVAHMTSYDQEPKCLMSRLVPGTGVNVGAQRIYKTHAQAKKHGSI